MLANSYLVGSQFSHSPLPKPCEVFCPVLTGLPAATIPQPPPTVKSSRGAQVKCPSDYRICYRIGG